MNEPILYYKYLADTLPDVKYPDGSKALKRPYKSVKKFEDAIANHGIKTLHIEDYKPSKNVMICPFNNLRCFFIELYMFWDIWKD